MTCAGAGAAGSGSSPPCSPLPLSLLQAATPTRLAREGGGAGLGWAGLGAGARQPAGYGARQPAGHRTLLRPAPGSRACPRPGSCLHGSWTLRALGDSTRGKEGMDSKGKLSWIPGQPRGARKCGALRPSTPPRLPAAPATRASEGGGCAVAPATEGGGLG